MNIIDNANAMRNRGEQIEASNENNLTDESPMPIAREALEIE